MVSTCMNAYICVRQSLKTETNKQMLHFSLVSGFWESLSTRRNPGRFVQIILSSCHLVLMFSLRKRQVGGFSPPLDIVTICCSLVPKLRPTRLCYIDVVILSSCSYVLLYSCPLSSCSLAGWTNDHANGRWHK